MVFVQFSLWEKKKENKLKENAQNVVCLVGIFFVGSGTKQCSSSESSQMGN
jgi:hypothetical protein